MIFISSPELHTLLIVPLSTLFVLDIAKIVLENLELIQSKRKMLWEQYYNSLCNEK